LLRRWNHEGCFVQDSSSYRVLIHGTKTVSFIHNSGHTTSKIVSQFIRGFLVNDNDLTIVRIDASTESIAFLNSAFLLNFFVVIIRDLTISKVLRLWER
jgi:hypothetical protein